MLFVQFGLVYNVSSIMATGGYFFAEKSYGENFLLIAEENFLNIPYFHMSNINSNSHGSYNLHKVINILDELCVVNGEHVTISAHLLSILTISFKGLDA